MKRENKTKKKSSKQWGRMDKIDSHEKEVIESPGQLPKRSGLDVLMEIINRNWKHPPSHPDWNPGWPDYCDEDRMFDLNFWAFSEAKHAIDNKLSPTEQKAIIGRLEQECSDVIDIVFHSMQRYEHLTAQQRQDYLKDSQRHCKKLVDFVEGAMRSGNLDHRECHRIIHAHLDLLTQDALMETTFIEYIEQQLKNKQPSDFAIDKSEIPAPEPIGTQNKAESEQTAKIDSQKADADSRVPLSKTAKPIYEKLKGLAEHEAMTLPEIQNWYESEFQKNLDEGTWKDVRKELKPYGLRNKPRIGYYIRE